MSRSRHPSIAFSMASTRLSSTKNSAGPPIPNEVRVASGSSSEMPFSSRSHATLVFVRQLIAQLLDVSGSHQQDHVVPAGQALELLFSPGEIADVGRVGDLVGKVGGLHP